MKTETLFHLIECSPTEETQVASTEPKTTMLQVIGGWYKDGYRFLESFTIGNIHYGVFTKQIEVVVSTPPMEAETKGKSIVHYHPESIDAVYQKLKGIAYQNVGWGVLSCDHLVQIADYCEMFNDRVQKEFGFNMGSISTNSIEKIRQGINQADYLYWVSTQIYTHFTTVEQNEPTEFETILNELKSIATETLGWSGFNNNPVPEGSIYGRFWKNIQTRLGYVPTTERPKNDGSQLEYLESIARNIIAARQQ